MAMHQFLEYNYCHTHLNNNEKIFYSVTFAGTLFLQLLVLNLLISSLKVSESIRKDKMRRKHK